MLFEASFLKKPTIISFSQEKDPCSVKDKSASRQAFDLLYTQLPEPLIGIVEALLDQILYVIQGST